MNNNNIKVSLIIINWNGLHYLRKLFDSMSDIMDLPDVEIILADNGSEDGSTSFIEKYYKNVILLKLYSNKGVSYARNRALEIANGKYLFILDNDVIFKKDVMDGMLSYMDEHHDVGMCGCKLVYDDGSIQESCKKFPGFWQKFCNLIKLSKGYSYADIMDKEPFEPVYIIGACQLLRREVYKTVGNLDEKIFYGPEDCDYCLRVHNAGWKIIYLPQYTMVHYCQRMTNRHPFSKMGLLHIFGLFYIYWKYKRLN